LRQRLPQWQEAAESAFSRGEELAAMQHRLNEIDDELAMGEDSNTIATADTARLIDGEHLAHIATGIDTGGHLDTGYRRDVPDILRTGDVIIGVQAATTVLYDVEIHLTDAAHPN